VSVADQRCIARGDLRSAPPGRDDPAADDPPKTSKPSREISSHAFGRERRHHVHRGGRDRATDRGRRSDLPSGALDVIICPPFALPPEPHAATWPAPPSANQCFVICGQALDSGETGETSLTMTLCSIKVCGPPHSVVMGTSAASRPTAIGTRAGRGESEVASRLCQVPPR
jgi:hypothetical protein